MPALPADIAAGTRRARIESWSSPTIKARYPSARDGEAQPAEGMFDSAAHAQAALAQRAALFGVERRRFAVPAQDLLWPDPATAILIIHLKEPEQAMDGKTIPARIEINLNDEATSFEVFG
jgi:hypothetical protein